MTVVHAYAKLNLTLVVGPRREDGLHEIATVMQQIDLADRLEVEAAPELVVEGFEDTLVTHALDLLEAVAQPGHSWRVRIDKAIPVAAGLGGGSADAAAALVTANAALERPLPVERLSTRGDASARTSRSSSSPARSSPRGRASASPMSTCRSAGRRWSRSGTARRRRRPPRCTPATTGCAARRASRGRRYRDRAARSPTEPRRAAAERPLLRRRRRPARRGTPRRRRVPGRPDRRRAPPSTASSPSAKRRSARSASLAGRADVWVAQPVC